MYLIKRKDRIFTHVGLFIDENTIFHYASKTNNMFSKDQEVKISSIDDFANGRKIFKCELCRKIDTETLMARAQSFKNNGKHYHFLTNNCISFVLSCLYGTSCISAYAMIKGMIKYKIQPLGFALR